MGKVFDSGKRARAALCTLFVISAFSLAACDSAEERAQKHYEKGMEYLAEGETIKATLEFRNTLKLQENYVPARFEIAKLYEADREWRAALGNYRLIVELEPEHVPARLGVARIMLAANQVDEALKEVTTASKIAPDDPDVLTMKAAVDLRLGNDEAARTGAEAALAQAPENSEARLILALLKRRAGDEAAAEALIDEGLKLLPDDLALSLFKLQMLEAGERTAEIGPLLTQMVESHPDQVALRQGLARWQISQNDLEGAEATLRAIARDHPEDPKYALDVAAFLRTYRDDDAARAELDRLIAERDDKFAFQSQRALLDFTTGQRQAAIDYMREVVAGTEDEQTGREAKVLLARFFYDDERRDDAAKLVEEVLAEDNKNVGALTLRGRLAIQRDDPESAIQDLRTALNEKPGSAEILELLSTAHARNGSADLAQERLAAAVKASNFEPRLSLRYANLLLGQNKPDLAEDTVLDSLKRNPRNRKLLSALARVRLARQDWVGAEEVANAIRQLDGDTGQSDQILAAVRMGEDRTSESIELLRETFEKDEFKDSSMAALVRTYVQQGQVDTAKDFLGDVLEANPKNAQALILKAAIAQMEGDADLAERSYRDAVAAAPEAPATHRALAAFYRRNLKQDKAEEVLRAGIAKLPEDVGLRFDLAMLLELTGRQEEAIGQYEILYDLQPSSTVIANNYASLLSDYRSDPESVATAARVAKRLRSSEFPAFQDTYGWVMFLSGDTNRALPALKAAAEALPQVPLVQYHLGVVYGAAGDKERAIAALEKAEELARDADPRTALKARRKIDELNAQTQATE